MILYQTQPLTVCFLFKDKLIARITNVRSRKISLGVQYLILCIMPWCNTVLHASSIYENKSD